MVVTVLFLITGRRFREDRLVHDCCQGIRAKISRYLAVRNFNLVVQSGIGVDGDVRSAGDVLGLVLDRNSVDEGYRLGGELNRHFVGLVLAVVQGVLRYGQGVGRRAGRVAAHLALGDDAGRGQGRSGDGSYGSSGSSIHTLKKEFKKFPNFEGKYQLRRDSIFLKR